jgi:hypothetical protein
MLRSKQVKNGSTEVNRLSSVVLVTGLIFGWSQSAFSSEPPHLQLAPIQFISRVGGNIGYIFQSTRVGSYSASQQSLGGNVDLTVAARSYLWQPWFSRVSATLGVSMSAAIAQSSNSRSTQSGGTGLTGEASLNMLPYTRFPFSARIYRNETQANGFLSGINSNYINSGFDISQNYRSLDGRFDSITSYGRSTNRRGSATPENISDQLNIYLTGQPLYSTQTFNVVGVLSNVYRPLGGERNLMDTLVANHRYQPNSIASVSSVLNLIKSTNIITPAFGSQQKYDYKAQQFSSFASWRPEGNPLTLTSSARLFRSNSRNNGIVASEFNDTNLNLGANYAWSNLLRMYGSVNINDNSGVQTISTAAALTAQKGFGERDSTTLGGFRYTRYVGASLGNQTTTTNSQNQSATTSVQQLGVSAGHSLSKSTTLGNGRFGTDLSQGLSTTVSSRGSPSTHLNHNGSLTWSRSEGKETSMVSLRAADSRTLSNPQNFFQLINLQASRNERLALNQSLVGNLTMQASRSGSKGVSTPFIGSSSADLTYRHERLFKVKNLSFYSTLKIQSKDIALSKNAANQQYSTTQDHANVSWENNFDYFIGRLKLNLNTRIMEANNVIQSSLFFSMSRSF